MELVAIVTVLILIEYSYMAARVGMARSKQEIEAPAVIGDPLFERTLRVQLNTAEQLVILLPALWLFAYYVSPRFGALLGLVFLVGRALYMRGYIEDPAKRGPGFLLGYAATGILLLGGLVGALLKAF